MRKKFQIFISSTYRDLIKERQACVEAVLRAGHIPAGMELFSAGNESQLDVVKRWIDDSDIYMLILGGRYGTIEPKSGLSYTEIEYRYAQETGKPCFSLVIAEGLLNEKVRSEGKEILELENPQKQKDFKELVLSKISRFFKDETEIKLSIFESLLDIQNRHQLIGWVKSNEVPDISQALSQISELTEKNNLLEQELNVIESGRIDKIGDFTYDELKNALEKIPVTVPGSISPNGKEFQTNVLSLFVDNRNALAIGITNRISTTGEEMFIISNVVAHLRIYDLAEIVKVTGVVWSKFQTSKLGNKFLAVHSLREKK